MERQDILGQATCPRAPMRWRRYRRGVEPVRKG